MGRTTRDNITIVVHNTSMECPMQSDLSKSLVVLNQDSTLIAVIELSLSS